MSSYEGCEPLIQKAIFDKSLSVCYNQPTTPHIKPIYGCVHEINNDCIQWNLSIMDL